MTRHPKDRKDRSRWYSVSVDTLRLLGVPAMVLVVVALAFFGYTVWQDVRIQQQATSILVEVEGLVEQLTTEEVGQRFRREYDEAWRSYQEALAAAGREDYPRALALGVESRDALIAIRRAMGLDGGSSREAQFVAVQGGVEYRRGERGRWQPARKFVLLQPGDQVRTSGNGSAEILFPDGTLFQVRKDSRVLVSGSGGQGPEPDEQRMEMEYGWVDLSTSKKPGKVTTPKARAEVEGESKGFVAYDRSSETGLYGAIQGRVTVESEDGEHRVIGELQQVVQRDEDLSQPHPMPPPPRLLEPPANFEVSADEAEELTLSWEPVPTARRYALEVSENHLFADNLIEDPARNKTSARLGIRGEGNFLWRVAAVGPDGVRGPWSEPRRFRVTSRADRGTVEDRTPPELEVVSVTSYGNIFIVQGQTEPGASVSINGEPVTVEAEGNFTKAVALDRDGPAVLLLAARDAWGNETRFNEPVFVESP